MPEADIASVWDVLETEAAGEQDSIAVNDAGVEVVAGAVLLGADDSGRRHLLVPLLPGEAFAEDQTGRAVFLLKVDHDGVEYMSAVCVQPDLNRVFAQFAWELLGDIAGSNSPARTTVESLNRWRRLFAEADSVGVLSDPKLIGLIGEALVLEEVLRRDESRDIAVWTGPAGSEHDFRSGSTALEVKATLVREGRVVSISSVDQLDPPENGTLHLAHFRMEPDPDGDSLPDIIARIRELGPQLDALLARLSQAGYTEIHRELYADRRFRIVERRVYDTEGTSFPRIVPSSFKGEVVPPGTLRISYSIDLSNEPPAPIDDDEVEALFDELAGT